MRDDRAERAEPVSFRSAIFEAEGTIDDVPVRARTIGGGLVMDTLVRQRAERLVELGEVFALSGEPVRYAASLSGGAPVQPAISPGDRIGAEPDT